MKPAYLASLALLTAGCATVAVPGSRIETPVQAGGAYSVPVASIKALRYRSTLHQQYDFSCGSAALATLLTHHYGHRVTEQDVFAEMYERGDKDKIRREGFSLLDMKHYLAARGYLADGFVADLDKLTANRVPAIALVKENGYHHFVVVKGVRSGRVLIGDPSTGTRALPEATFRQMWIGGILFVIHNRLETARFNADGDWQTAPLAPLADAVYRGGAEATLPKRGPSDY